MTSAEEAIARAKAIAARLSAGSTAMSSGSAVMGSTASSTSLYPQQPQNATNDSYDYYQPQPQMYPPEDPASLGAVLDAAFADGTHSSSGASGSKRKRWGTDVSSSAAESTTTNLPDVNDAIAAALSADAKRLKALDDASSSTDVSKRIWIPVDKNPGYNYIGLLIGPGGSKQRQLIEQSGGHVRISIRGRGSGGAATGTISSTDPVPGKPEEPLHVLLEGRPENVKRAEELINELLHDSAKAQAEKDRQLAQVNAAKNEASLHLSGTYSSLGDDANLSSYLDSSTASMNSGNNASNAYTPKPVTQLLGLNTPTTNTNSTDNDLIQIVEEKIGVPNGLVGFIIGKGGESITMMQRKSGAKVQIQKEHEMEPGSTMRIITLLGPNAEAVATCREIIEGMVQERTRMNVEHQQQRSLVSGGGFTSSSSVMGPGSNAAAQVAQLQQALALGHVHVQMQVPNGDVGLIIGRGGTTIKMIQERTGANVQIPPQPDENNPLIRTINITHPVKDQVEIAKYFITGVLAKSPEVLQQLGIASGVGGGQYGGAAGSDVSIQVQIPDKDVGMCIGRSGCVIRELQQRTRTRIQIPQSVFGQEYRVITVTGPPDGCQKIQEILNRIVLEQSSQFVMTGECFQTMAYPYGQQAAAGYGQYYQQYATVATPAANQADYSAQWAAYYASLNQVGQQVPAATTSTAVQAAASSTAAGAARQGSTQQLAPDTYYDAFFQYAYHYGEDKARQYYGAWSPPVGTQNPYGVNPALQSAGGAASAQPKAK